MRVIQQSRELQTGSNPICAAIGVFDGVHLGHQEVIRQTQRAAKKVGGLTMVITFDRHPSQLLAPDRAPKMIYPATQKLRVLESQGVDVALMFCFDEAFSRRPAEAFVRDLVQDFGNLRSLCVGKEFTFGYQRSGNVSLLHTLGKELGFEVSGVPEVVFQDRTISSTRIRKAIADGELGMADQMLGRRWSLCGRVVHGDHRGRELGFPTANLEPSGLALPPNGVYAVEVRGTQRPYEGVLNIGFRPTLAASAPRLQVEVHLLDFQGDLYDQELELHFVARIRDEQKFPSLDVLKAQIQRDIESTRKLFH